MFVLDRASIWQCTLSAKGDGVYEGVAIPRMVLWVGKDDDGDNAVEGEV
jgi:hypothetical protein